MKNILVFLFSGFAFCVGAQNDFPAKFKVGLAIGVTKTNYRFTNTDYTNQYLFIYQNCIQENYTAFADINLSKRFELSGEISFQDLGWERKDTAKTIEHPSGLLTRYRYHYIGFSAIAGYKFLEKGIWSLYGTAGGGIAFLVNASSKTMDDGKIYSDQAPLLNPQKQVASVAIGVKNNFQLRPRWGMGVTISGLQYLTKIEPVIIVKTRMTGVATLSSYFIF